MYKYNRCRGLLKHMHASHVHVGAPTLWIHPSLVGLEGSTRQIGLRKDNLVCYGMRKQRLQNFSKADLRRLAKTFPPPLCRYYFVGHCPSGNACPFSHDAARANTPATISTLQRVQQPAVTLLTATSETPGVPAPKMPSTARAGEAQQILKRKTCWDGVTQEAGIKRVRPSGPLQFAHCFDEPRTQPSKQAQTYAQAHTQALVQAQLQI